MAYIRKRGKTWSFTVDIGRDPLTNARRQKVGSGFESESAARVACEKFLKSHERGERTENITLAEFIKEYYENEVKHQITESSYQNQCQWARDYIIPKLGKQRVNRITHMHIIKFYNTLLTEGISRGLIRNVSMVLSKSLKAAVVWGFIDKDPTAHASPPSYKAGKMKIWTEDEMKDFLVRSENLHLHPLYVLALTSGMRMGEMLALTWEDLNFKDNEVTITKSLKYTVTSGLHIKRPKTSNSFRNISLPQYTMDKLKHHRDIQPVELPKVFHNAREYIYPSEASRFFQRDCVSLDMPIIRFHDLRHTHATYLLQKYNVKVVAERLGDTVNTVLNTYAHVLPTMQKEVATHLETMFNPVDNSDNVIKASGQKDSEDG